MILSMAISTSSTGSSAKATSRFKKGTGALSAGYTFIEMVVTVTIIIMISTVALGYSSSIGKQMLLLRTQAQLVALFNYARSLSQNFRLTPPEGKLVCSYGVHVQRIGADTGQFFIFQDLVDDTQTCADDANHIYDPADEKLTGELNDFRMDTTGLAFGTSGDQASPDIGDVVFIPPNPDVIINDDSSVNSGSVIVRIIGTSNQFELRVNTFAQITAQ